MATPDPDSENVPNSSDVLSNTHTTLKIIDDSDLVFGNTANIWTTYNTEATKEDQALAQDIREDMNSTLIFTGLFSATVTAFLVESYKNLQPDPDIQAHTDLANISQILDQITLAHQTQHQDMMIQALIHISRQLANEPNISSFSLPVTGLQVGSMINGTQNLTLPPFQPTNLHLTSNLLWFLSLFCCLGCALVACLALQWTRHFLQIIESYVRPADRGRIRTYLRDGLHRFHLKSAIDTVPVLLHLSLFFFLSGLSLFLFTVNNLIGWISVAVLIILSVGYLAFTILPVIYSNCPYNTPLSKWCLRVVNYLRRKGYSGTFERVAIPYNTFEEAIHISATQSSDERSGRDSWAIQEAVTNMDHNGSLLDFMNSASASQHAGRKTELGKMLNMSDLPLRFINRFGEFEGKIYESQVEHIVLCLQIAENLRGDEVYYGKASPTDYSPKGHFSGAKHMNDAFSALQVFKYNQSRYVRMPNRINASDIKRRLGDYAFSLLRDALGRLFENAKKLHQGIQHQLQSLDPSHLAEVQKQLKDALEVFDSTGFRCMDEVFPFVDEIHKVWTEYLKLVECHISSNNLTSHDERIKKIFSEYGDLLIRIHYLQLLALFHSASQCCTGDLKKEQRWTQYLEEVREYAKYLAGLQKGHYSGKDLPYLFVLYFKHRLDWPHRGCWYPLPSPKKSFSNQELHLEGDSVDILLISMMIKGEPSMKTNLVVELNKMLRDKEEVWEKEKESLYSIYHKPAAERVQEIIEKLEPGSAKKKTEKDSKNKRQEKGSTVGRGAVKDSTGRVQGNQFRAVQRETSIAEYAMRGPPQ